MCMWEGFSSVNWLILIVEDEKKQQQTNVPHIWAGFPTPKQHKIMSGQFVLIQNPGLQ